MNEAGNGTEQWLHPAALDARPGDVDRIVQAKGGGLGGELC